MAEEIIKKERPAYEVAVYDKKVKNAFLQVADEKTYLKEVIFAYQAIKANSMLQNCHPDSIRNAIVNVALVGVTLNPALKQAFLIPRKNNGKVECCLDLSARGLCQVARESKAVLDINPVAVYEGDEFYYELGLNPVLRHIPKMTGEKKTVVAAYSVAVLQGGVKTFVVIDKEKIERARKISQAPNSPMWKDHYDEGAKKTVVKLQYKYLPQNERISQAIEVLNHHEGVAEEKPNKAIEVMERFGLIEDQTVIDAEVENGNGDKVSCPKLEGALVNKANCGSCDEREGCPAHD
jgi:recombination protein RecT